MKKLAFIFSLLIIFTQYSAYSSGAEGFNQWLRQFKAEAVSKGIRRATVENAFSGAYFNRKIIDLDRKQPEFTMNFAQYKVKIVNENRIAKAKKMLSQHYSLLDRVEKTYGVPKRFIVALWAIETNFGEVMGDFYIPNALANLAYDGRRSEFFKTELLHSLKILDQGHIQKQYFKGSWAGAMGQCQFMPSSFMSYAQDFDGDGHKNVWQSKPDVFASIANYLKSVGWNGAYTWGRRVNLPVSFDKRLVNDKINRPLSFFASRGVKTLDGRGLSTQNISARIISPDEDAKQRGEYYIVYSNFDKIMHWNRSTYFATSVGLIADRLM